MSAYCFINSILVITFVLTKGDRREYNKRVNAIVQESWLDGEGGEDDEDGEDEGDIEDEAEA